MSFRLATASSMGLVTSVSIASGPAPGYTVVTTTTGMSTDGSSSTPSFVHPTRPMTRTAPMAMSVATGRWIAKRVSVMLYSLPSA